MTQPSRRQGRGPGHLRAIADDVAAGALTVEEEIADSIIRGRDEESRTNQMEHELHYYNPKWDNLNLY